MADYFYKSIPALCQDGNVRKVRARHHVYDGSLAADTFFSVPARVTIGKRTVTGYITGRENQDGKCPYEFRVHTKHESVFQKASNSG